MTSKISKKNQTPEEEAAERAAMERFKRRRSPHFAVGTDIVVNNRRAEVLDHWAEGLWVAFEDDPLPGDLVTPVNWRAP